MAMLRATSELRCLFPTLIIITVWEENDSNQRLVQDGGTMEVSAKLEVFPPLFTQNCYSLLDLSKPVDRMITTMAYSVKKPAPCRTKHSCVGAGGANSAKPQSYIDP